MKCNNSIRSQLAMHVRMLDTIWVSYLICMYIYLYIPYLFSAFLKKQ